MQERIRDLAQRAAQWFEPRLDAFAADLAALVRQPSVCRGDLAQPGAPYGPDCRKALDLALSMGQREGFVTRDMAGHAGEIHLDDKSQELGMFAHLDVVPAGDGWDFPCFGGERVDDWIVGRGAIDNKGAAVLGLYALMALRELQVPLAHGVRLVMGCNEEAGMDDMLYYRDHAQMPVASLVPDCAFPVNHAQKAGLRATLRVPMGEQIVLLEGGDAFNSIPSAARAELLGISPQDLKAALAGKPVAHDRLTISAGQSGAIMEASGIGGHAARPEGTLSAVWVLCNALGLSGLLKGKDQAAMDFAAAWTKESYGQTAGIACEEALSGKLTMITGIARGQAGQLSLSLDARIPVHADLDAIQAALAASAADWGATLAIHRVSAAHYLPLDDPRVMALMEVYQTLAGRDDPAYVMGGGTYSRLIPNAISFGLTFPEGSPQRRQDNRFGSVHMANEAADLHALKQAFPILIAALCRLDTMA